MTGQRLSTTPDLGSGVVSLRVLVVDDDPAEFALIQAGFCQCQTRIELLTATSAPMAMAELVFGGPGGQPNIAVVDVNMPLVSGFALAELLIREAVPTLLISVQISGERTARAKRIGAIDLLVKPTDVHGYAQLAGSILDAVGWPRQGC